MSRKRKPKDSDGRRTDAVQALNLAAKAWLKADAHDGDPMAVAMVRILAALIDAAHEGDIADIEKKGGPERWARARIKARDGKLSRSLGAASGEAVFPVQADAAKQFVRSIGGLLKAYRGDPAHPWLALTRRATSMEYAEQALTRVAARLGSAGIACSEDSIPRIAEEVRKVATRERADAKAFAVAVLKGVGLSSDSARDMLKNKD